MRAVWFPEQLMSLYRDMYLIRRFEERRAVRSRHSVALLR
jgi:TPP-dependent pyruvate/acetoin dehydrogenase alpha subunit